MAAVAMELDSVLSLPVLDRRVPRTIRFPNPKNDEATSDICRERIRAGLDQVLPQRGKHHSAEDVLQEQFRAILGPEPLSETYLEFTVDLSGSEMMTESGVELGNHIALFALENEVNISAPIAALQALQPGLGKRVYAQFCDWFDRGPGMISDQGLFSMYDSYRLEDMCGGGAPENDIREYLLCSGCAAEEIESLLPEAILAALGGKDLVWGNNPVPLAKLCTQLRACKVTALEDVATALEGVQEAYKAYDAALDLCAGLVYRGDSYYEPIRLTAEPGKGCTPIIGFYDECKQDSMNNGEYDAHFALTHVTYNHTPQPTKGTKRQPKPILVDGMQIAALVVRYFSALDTALCALQKIGANDAIPNQPKQG